MNNIEVDQFLLKLSIIVLSYNKTLGLKALLKHWRSYPVQLIVIDGSKEPFSFDMNLNLNSNFEFKYFHEPISYQERIKKATRIRSRKYTLLSADDEIHLPLGLSKSIKFLEINIEFNSCIGKSLRLIKIKNNFKLEKTYHNLDLVNSTQIYSDVFKRVINYFDNYVCATYYSVARSTAWRENFKNAFDIQTSCPFAMERLVEFTNIAKGKCHVHNNVSWIRNCIDQPNYSTLDRKITLSRWIKNITYKKEHNEIKNLMKNYGIKKENIDYIFLKIFKPPKRSLNMNFLKSYLMYRRYSRESINIIRKVLSLIYKKLFNKKQIGLIRNNDFISNNETVLINEFISEKHCLFTNK